VWVGFDIRVVDNVVHRGTIPGFPLFYLVPARLLAGFDDLLIFD
jgi:hypothetical protein